MCLPSFFRNFRSSSFIDCKSSLLTFLSVKVGTQTVMVSENLLSAASEVLIRLFIIFKSWKTVCYGARVYEAAALTLVKNWNSAVAVMCGCDCYAVLLSCFAWGSAGGSLSK